MAFASEYCNEKFFSRTFHSLTLISLVIGDDAINTFRATSSFIDSVRACSSLDQKEQLRRRWIRYPLEVVKRKLFPQNTENFDTRNTRNAFLAAASIAGGLTGQIQVVANQILAAIGYNVWVPKIPGQKGIRILSLDGTTTHFVYVYLHFTSKHHFFNHITYFA